MKLLALEGVRGVMLFGASGERLFGEFRIGGTEATSTADWFALATSLGPAREQELVFERGRVYMRRARDTVLVVIMGLIAPSAVVRLHCDALLPSLCELPTAKGFARFLKRVACRGKRAGANATEYYFQRRKGVCGK